MENYRKHVFLLLLLCMAIWLSGCASPASKDALIARGVPGVQHYQKTLAITTQGGYETTSIDGPNVSNTDFGQAIKESIIDNGLFTQVLQDNSSEYLLNVTIVNMSKPLFGANFTVTMEAAWSLSETSTKQYLMRKAIKSSHTATMGEAFAAVTRLRLALEGAVQKNIEQGIIALSELNLN